MLLSFYPCSAMSACTTISCRSMDCWTYEACEIYSLHWPTGHSWDWVKTWWLEKGIRISEKANWHAVLSSVSSVQLSDSPAARLPACVCLAQCWWSCRAASALCVWIPLCSQRMGEGDPTRETVIAKSSVNRGHPVWTLFEIAHIIALNCRLLIVAIFWQPW